MTTVPWDNHSIAANGEAIKDNFAAWFGDSKVRDRSGNPLMVYHGTGSDFSAFDPGLAGSTWGADRMGIFFTSEANEASTYSWASGPTSYRSEGQNVMPVYISVRRPVDISALQDFVGDDGILDRYESPIDVMDAFRDDIEAMLLGDPMKDWYVDINSKASKNNFYDGVIFEIGGKTLVAAVAPEQIKSAIGNAGLYLGNSGDLCDTEAARQLELARSAYRSIESTHRLKETAP